MINLIFRIKCPLPYDHHDPFSWKNGRKAPERQGRSFFSNWLKKRCLPLKARRPSYFPSKTKSCFSKQLLLPVLPFYQLPCRSPITLLGNTLTANTVISCKINAFTTFQSTKKKPSEYFYALRRMSVTSCPSRWNGKGKGDFSRNTFSSMFPQMFVTCPFSATQGYLSAAELRSASLSGKTWTGKTFPSFPGLCGGGYHFLNWQISALKRCRSLKKPDFKQPDNKDLWCHFEVQHERSTH